jgi:hypothetical protein
MNEFHKVADLFPPMTQQDYETLTADIRAHGLREPIVRYHGAVVDGRHRLQICEELRIQPHFKEFDGDEPDLLPFVISMNLARRHLTTGQRAALGARIEEYVAVFAKQRQLAAQNNHAGRAVKERIPEQENGQARDEAAKRAHTNGHYVTDYKKIEREAPAIAAEVANGTMTLPKALALVKNPPTDAEPEAEAPQPTAPERLLKRNATLTASWIWPEPVEAFVKSRITGLSLNVCSGASELGDVRVDLDPKTPDVIKADMRDLPFPDESFDTVISDPPWRTGWFDRWRPFFELVRVVRVGGKIIFNSYYVPWSKQVKLVEVFVRQDERFANASILSVFQRIQRITNRKEG